MIGTTADDVRRDLDASKRAVVKAGDELTRLRAEVARLTNERRVLGRLLAAMLGDARARGNRAQVDALGVIADALARGDGAS